MIDKNVTRWRAQIEKAADAHPPVTAALLAGLVQEESGGNPTIRSGAGAAGLTQLEPATAMALGVRPGDLTDPQSNLDAGAHYLAMQHAEFGSWDLALAAYNAGPGNVEKAGRQVPPYSRAYVDNILALEREYAAAGFSDVPGEPGSAPEPAKAPEPPPPTATVKERADLAPHEVPLSKHLPFTPADATALEPGVYVLPGGVVIEVEPIGEAAPTPGVPS